MSLDVAAAADRPPRLPTIDALRGIAIAAMVVYHFSWDLRFFGFISADVAGDLGWRLFARAIAGSFLALVGVSLVLATRNGLKPGRFLRRLAVITAAAAAVTIATRIIFPESFVFFGILHAIALFSVLGLAFVRAPVPVVVAAALFCFLAPRLVSGGLFDHPALLFVGLASYAPRSNDFVPIFPWFGVVLAGILAARLAPRLRPGRFGADFAAGSTALAPLAWAGRHSLVIYLLHQPLLFGLVYLVAQITPPSLAGFEASYVESCSASCAGSGTEEPACRAACQCLVERSKAENLWAGVVQNSLSDEEVQIYFDIAEECRRSATQDKRQ
jgi:uncharacterized membrane protein